MAWIFLIAAGLLEVVWAYFMKLSEGFSKGGPTAITFAAMFASFWLLSEAMKTLPLGTSYAVWTGIGAVGAFILGITFLAESTSPLRLLAAGLIFTGLVLMKVSSPE